MHCNYCGKDLSDINKFVFHLEYAHNNMTQNNFVCPFNYCSRSFHRKDSFKKHLNLKHVSEDDNKDVKTANSIECDSGGTNLSFNFPSFAQSSQNNIIDPSEPQHNFDSGKRRSDFLFVLQKSVSEFVYKLQNDPSLSRKLVQTCIEYMKDFLNSGFLSILKDFFVNPCDNELLESNFEIMRDLIENIHSCFNSLDTDYKRIKCAENSTAYIYNTNFTCYWHYHR